MNVRRNKSVNTNQIAWDLWGLHDETTTTTITPTIEGTADARAAENHSGEFGPARSGNAGLSNPSGTDQQQPVSGSGAVAGGVGGTDGGLESWLLGQRLRAGRLPEPVAPLGLADAISGELRRGLDDPALGTVPAAVRPVQERLDRGDNRGRSAPDGRGDSLLEVRAERVPGGDRPEQLSAPVVGAELGAERAGGADAGSDDRREVSGLAAAENNGTGGGDSEPRRGAGPTRVLAGVRAAGVLDRMVSEDRGATAEERQLLNSWPGWGATPALFDEDDSTYSAERAQLKLLWTADEWDAARRTVINAHYTDPEFVSAIWAAVTATGFSTGTVLEPGSGSGNFIGAAPAGMQMVGVELDPTSAAISRALYPEADIRTESFAVTGPIGSGVDAVIGNVPFSRVSLFDKEYNPDKLSMHNHFILKSLRLTKPGGIVAVLTSRFTLDAVDPKARELMAQHGTLLGAVRLPEGAHVATAGTEVVTDLLIFRKNRPGKPDPNANDWVPTERIRLDGHDLVVNSYLLAHRENILGTLASRTGQFGPEVTVRDLRGGQPVGERLRRAAVTIAETAVAANLGWAAETTTVTDAPPARVIQEHANTVGRLSLDSDGVSLHGIEGPARIKIDPKVRAEIAALLVVRDAAVQLLDAEAGSTLDTAANAELRAGLNLSYDSYVAGHGPINRMVSKDTGRVDEDGDPIVTRKFPPAIQLLREDPHFSTVLALEHFDEESGVARKAALFDRRVVGAVHQVTTAANAQEAIAVSLDRTGRIDTALIGALLNLPEDQLAESLNGLVFADPAANNQFVVAGEYLSGNVRAKLKIANAAAETDPSMLANAAALEKVIPLEHGPAEIQVRPGAAWVPVADMKLWLSELLRKEVKECEYLNGKWDFTLRGSVDSATEVRWGIKGDHSTESAATFVKSVLNGAEMKMTYPMPGEEKKTLIDTVGTEAMAEKKAALEDVFQDWLWAEPARAERLQTLYNDKFNGIVLRSYKGTVLTLPGKAMTFTPRPHQHEAIARMVAEESVGLFHQVGAGKTAEMICGVVELKRLGMVEKPLVVVPNSMLEQFTREFKQLYPRAQVLSAGSADLAKSGTRDGRKLFVAKAATGDWDAVIMTQGAFKRINLGSIADDYIHEQLIEKRAQLAAIKNSPIKAGRGVKSIEKTILSMEEKLKAATDIPRDAGVTFEQTGIDYLCIDEAHGYKNLTVASAIPDFGRTGSAKAQDLDMKLWYLRSKLGRSRVVTLATATPISNSLVEMYVIQKYLRPSMLADAGVSAPDEWAAQFAEQVAVMEQNGRGGFHLKTRTAKFRNVSELLHMWHSVGDIKTVKDLKLPVPLLTLRPDGTRTPMVIAVPATEIQREGIRQIGERAEAVKGGNVDPRDDNMLKISNDGRSIALDQRLQGEGNDPGDDERTKIEYAATEIMTRWHATKDTVYVDEDGNEAEHRGALQLVFSDRGTPNPDKWNVYDGLKAELIERGMPAHLIRFIHDAKNDDEKAALFARARTGQIAVFFGSTEKAGTGVNIQDRAIALHHLDCPWRPSDVTQREGRIIRQGNQNSTVEVLRYVTEGSFDGYMWQGVTRKASGIDQVMSGALDIRELEDMSEEALSYAEVTAIAAGDMRILEKVQLDADIQKISRQERAFNRERTSVQARSRDLTEKISRHNQNIAAGQHLLSSFIPTTGDAFTAEVRDMRRLAHNLPATITEREAAGLAMQQQLVREVRPAMQRMSEYHNAHPRPLPETQIRVGTVQLDAKIRYNSKDPSNPFVQLVVAQLPVISVEIPFSELHTLPPASLARRVELRTASIPTRVTEWEDSVTELTVTRGELDLMGERVWSKKGELDELRARRDTLVTEMTATPEGPEIADTAEPDADSQPASAAASADTVFRNPFTPNFGGGFAPGRSPADVSGNVA